MDVEFARLTKGKMVFFGGGAIAGATAMQALDLKLPVTIYIGDDVAPDADKLKARLALYPEWVVDGFGQINN